MLTISKPISAGQARAYHEEEFQNTRASYYTEVDKIRGEWHGQLAERRGLRGEVQEEHFTRLAEGQHPITGEQLVKHQTAREYRKPDGGLIRTIEHRAGWDPPSARPRA